MLEMPRREMIGGEMVGEKQSREMLNRTTTSMAEQCRNAATQLGADYLLVKEIMQ